MGRRLVRGAVAVALLGALATIGQSVRCELMRLDVANGAVREVAECRGQPPLVEALAQLQRVIPPELLDARTWSELYDELWR